MCTIYQIFRGDGNTVDNTLEYILEENPNVSLERYIPTENAGCESGYHVLSVVSINAE